jgi:hypothetical protein
VAVVVAVSGGGSGGDGGGGGCGGSGVNGRWCGEGDDADLAIPKSKLRRHTNGLKGVQKEVQHTGYRSTVSQFI